jgi:site-specific recombinase XerD
LDERLERFLTYLDAEKNASPLTLQSYRNDIMQFLALLERAGADLRETDHYRMRRFLAWLKEKGIPAALWRESCRQRALFCVFCRGKAACSQRQLGRCSPAAAGKRVAPFSLLP